MTFEVKSGYFGYGSKEILHNINFNLETAEILSVLGPNGVGKTTLLKCMMGLLKWHNGESYIDEQNLKTIPSNELWKKIAYVPQAKASAFGYTALDMVLLGRSAHIKTLGQPNKDDLKIALDALEEVGIIHLKDKLCTKMSGGELQMVLIARALCAKPQMLVLDEPESNLDFKNQLLILQILHHLSREHGISAIINTHYPSHALKIADKALILNRGGRSIFGEATTTINEENMRNAFGVDVHIADFAIDHKNYKSVVPIKIIC